MSNHENEGLGLEVARFTRGSLWRKIRIPESDSNSDGAPADESSPGSHIARSLDILICILCHMDHEHLSKLKLVSKTMREAVKEAKRTHFAYNTPKKTVPFRDDLDEEMEAPNAPIPNRRTIKRGLDLSTISKVLFK